MANPGYVRSTDGADADNGSTWALSNATLSGAMADQVAGDRIWVSDAHSETTAGAITITMPGTLSSPTQIYCGDDVAEPPTALTTTAIVATTLANSISINGSGYIYGIEFSAGSGTSSASIINQNTNADAVQIYDTCRFILAGNNSGGRMLMGPTGTAAVAVTWKDCNVKFAHASQGLAPRGAMFKWFGGTVIAAGTTPTAVIVSLAASNKASNVEIAGVDFSGFAATVSLVLGSGVSGGATAVFRGCTLPALWSGTLVSGAVVGPGARISMYNCDSADTNYRLWVEDYFGSIKHDAAIYLDASDGTTSISWKMVSVADAEYPLCVLYSDWILIWNTATGGTKVVTVEIVHDNAIALNNNEVWAEAEFLSGSTAPLSDFAHDAPATLLTATAAQTTSTAAWTDTGGFTNVNKQKLEVTTGTINEAGWIRVRVALAKASYTIYVDPSAAVA